MPDFNSKLRTRRHQGLAFLVIRKHLEVIDKQHGEVLSLALPLRRICIGITGIQDATIDIVQRKRDLQVEHIQVLGLGLLDGAIENGVDNRAGILDGYASAGSVPACVHQVVLGINRLHPGKQFLSILDRVQGEEGLAETCREGRRRLGDTPLGAGQLGGESGQEVILGLLGCQLGDGW